jgi:plasmid replication initiation protein
MTCATDVLHTRETLSIAQFSRVDRAYTEALGRLTGDVAYDFTTC